MSETFGHPGSDLSSYREQLSRGRQSRTLSLRRVKRPTIAGLLGVSSLSQSKISKSTQIQAFTVDNTLSIINSKNENEIISHFSKIIDLASQPKILLNLAQNQDICLSLVDLLQDPTFSERLKILILSATEIFFPLSQNLQEQYADGLVFVFLEYFESGNPEIILHIIHLISVIVETSGYARDSIISFGLHNYLINFASSESDENLTIASCNAIYHIFASPEDIDIKIMQDNVPILKPLFGLSSIQAVKSIILTFNEMAHKNPSIVYIYFDNGIYNIALELLSNPNFVLEDLYLIGNLCLGKREHIQVLLDNNLYQMLLDLYQYQNLQSTVLWVLSNLAETAAPLVLPLIDPSFIGHVLESTNDCNFEGKKESAYFISTLIVFSPSDHLSLFLCAPVAESLVEMCSSGVSLIVSKCISALLRLVMFVQIGNDGGEFITYLLQNDLGENLHEVLQSDNEEVKERANTILMILDSMQHE